MKIKITLLLLLAVSIGHSQIGTFATKKSLGNDLSARSDAGMVSINDKLYILGGYDGSGPKDFTAYTPTTGEVNKLENLGSGGANPLSSRCLFTIHNKIYSISAYGTGISEYDFSTNNWTYLAPLVGGLNPDTGFIINDIIYIISQTDNNFYSYNPATNTLTQKAKYPDTTRRGAFAFEINGKGYMGSGTTDTSNPVTNNFYEYDPITNNWATKANLPTAFSYGVGISKNGKGYAGLGEIKSNLVSYPNSPLWYEYDPLLNSWTPKQNFLNLSSTNVVSSLTRSAISVINDDIYIFGGRGIGTTNNSPLRDDVYKYNVVSNTWETVATDLGKNRTEATGFYSNGKIYVGGGQDDEELVDFWEYDIATDNWTPKANLPTSHCQRASVEINGKGYFVGGYGKSIQNTTPNPMANYSDELLEYDPITNTWTNKAPFPAGKKGGMTSMAYNGKLYAGFGNNMNNSPTTAFYEYNPTTNSWTSKANAPFTGSNLSSFVIGNTGYVITFYPTPLMAKYNFDTDVWTTESHNIGSSPTYNNQAFSYNGFGYIAVGVYNGEDILWKYNPATNTWAKAMNLPFKNPSQTIIPTPNGIYFGFGESGVNHPIGISKVNDWRFLKFDATVSDQFGSYQSLVNVGYLGQTICGTGNLDINSSHSVYDNNGDLFSTVIASSVNAGGACYEINATDLAIPFKTATANFGNGYQENGMFLNKTATFVNRNILGGNGTFRLYYTTAELNKLVQDFNAHYDTNKTIEDIKIVKYFDYNTPSDSNPTNNTKSFSYSIYNTSIKDYGTDKYFDINFSPSNSVMGEIYAVLLTTKDLSTTAFENSKISIYPNPASNILNIQLSDNNSIDEIIITDLSGKKVKAQKGNTSTINIENLSKGIYILEVFSGELKLVDKFIKEE